tara:strand:- start:97 stop:1221 length:1125 start_codon:yes stop_codon:yes gene_type:complete
LARFLKENKKYPSGWRMRRRFKSGLFYIYFKPPPSAKHLWDNKTEIKLGSGKTLQIAERKAFEFWASKISTSEKPYTLGALFTRYQTQVIPNKAKQTQKSNLQSMTRLRSVFDPDQPVIDFKTHQVFQYRDYVHLNLSAKRANLDLEVLSHMFSKAIEWGCEIRHPSKSIVGKIPIDDRDRYVTDDELDCLLEVCNALLKVYIPLKMATGKDKSMLLRIKLSDITKDGLHFSKREKTKGKKGGKASFLPFEYEGQSTGLKEIIDNIIIWRTKWLKVQCFYLFASSTGQPLVNSNGETSNFDAQWQRAMSKAIKETELTEKFQERDLRAKTASDVESAEHAAKLLQHHSTATTNRVYRRKPEIVIPFQRLNSPTI